MNPEPTPQPAPAATLQSFVSYFAGITTFSAKPAVLQVVDGRIQLVEVDPTTRQATRTVFDVLPAQIAKIRGSASTMTLRIDGQRYVLDFSPSAVALMPAGLVGAAIAIHQSKTSGIGDWAVALRGLGVDIRITSIGRIMGITFIAIFGILAAIILVAVIYGKLSGN